MIVDVGDNGLTFEKAGTTATAIVGRTDGTTTSHTHRA